LPVLLREGYDQNDEAQIVADEIVRLVQSGDYRLSDCAVMYRINAQSRILEEAFLSRGLRYQIIGGIRFYERKEVKDLLAYLRLCLNPNDSVSLERIINIPPRGIGTQTLTRLNRHTASSGLSLYQVLHQIVDHPTAADAPLPDEVARFSTKIHNALRSFTELLDSLIEARAHRDLVMLIEVLLDRLQFQAALVNEYGSEDGAERWANVQELLTVANEYRGLPREAQLPTFLEEIALVSDLDKLNDQVDKVTCVTLHQAKGLEYPVVFLIGLEEGLLPHSRSTDEREKLEEERRLFYVGVTRAKERLYLLYAFRRAFAGRINFSDPSRFLKDIPSHLLQIQTSRTQATTPLQRSQQRPERPAAPGRTHSAVSSAPAPPRTLQFQPGERVRHPNFGEGEVVSSRPIEGDEEVIVIFDEQGQKKLLATFAQLQRVGE
jgi:DNA helicase-2/ATP-dependent DNA helicase PcrA